MLDTITSECGEHAIIAREDMAEEVTYCDGIYHYALSRRPRRLAEGMYTPTEPVYGCKGYCPSHRKAQGWSDPFEGMTFETFERSNDPTNAFEQVFNFRLPGKLILGGSRGRGKTHLARAAFSGMVAAGKSCVWFKAPEMAECFRRFAGNYEHEVQTEASAFWHKVRFADCIFIDDLAEERLPLDANGKPKSDLFNEQFKLLLESAKSLVITTNLDYKMLKDRYGEKINDRLFEHVLAVRMEGENYRAKSFPRLKG